MLARESTDESANEVPMPDVLVRDEMSDGNERTCRAGLPWTELWALSSTSIASSAGEVRSGSGIYDTASRLMLYYGSWAEGLVGADAVGSVGTDLGDDAARDVLQVALKRREHHGGSLRLYAAGMPFSTARSVMRSLMPSRSGRCLDSTQAVPASHA